MRRPRIGAMPRAAVWLSALFLVTGSASGRPASQLPTGDVQVVARDAFRITDATGTMVVLLGADGPLVLGVQTPSLVARTRAFLMAHGAGAPRFAVATSADSALSYGDGGWAAGGGTTTVAHEGLRLWMRFTPQVLRPGVDAPRLGFSEVLQMALDGDEIHFVHQPAGYSNADFIVHFEKRHFVYMGNLFTSDGYPAIDLEHGGSVTGLINAAQQMLSMFGDHPESIQPVIPGRGPLASVSDLRVYHGMLTAVRERVRQAVRAGKSVDQVVSARPTADFDERWARGPVAPDRFVRLVYRSLLAEASTQPGHGSH